MQSLVQRPKRGPLETLQKKNILCSQGDGKCNMVLSSTLHPTESREISMPDLMVVKSLRDFLDKESNNKKWAHN